MADRDDNATLLFVDDEENLLNIAREFFSRKGYRVITARNGAEALDVLKAEEIDCCFTDIHMPEMDGLELAENIRQIDNTIPVVVMTGYPSMDNIIHTLRNGVVDVLIKPVNLNQMEACLCSVMRERRLFTDNLFLKQEVEKKRRLEKLNRQMQSRIEQLQMFTRVMERFSITRNSAAVLRQLVKLTVEATEADEARFYLVSGDIRQPLEAASYLVPDIYPLLPDDAIRIWEAEEIARMAKAASKNGSRSGETSERLPRGLAGYIAIPMFIREKRFGILTAATRAPRSRAFNKNAGEYMEFMVQHASYAIENLALYENIYENLLSTLDALVQAIDAKDTYTRRHSNEVTELALALAEKLGLSQEDRDVLAIAGPLHDVGKIGIRDEVLLKPGALDEREFQILQSHSVIGAGIVGRLGLWNREQEVIRHHHEHFDGSGYPDGLAGEEIPYLARILAVADAYNAMTTDRVYRPRMPFEKAFDIICDDAGRHFDPAIVRAFRELFQEGHPAVFGGAA
ncbi:MAG: transcriptional regulator [Desulfobacterales bacterium]|nr:MAG: transcriptional regulator [Desulfobacterales bacterium]